MALVRYVGGTWRVGGLLALSRAFGDAYMKVLGRAAGLLYMCSGAHAYEAPVIWGCMHEGKRGPRRMGEWSSGLVRPGHAQPLALSPAPPRLPSLRVATAGAVTQCAVTPTTLGCLSAGQRPV